LGVFPLEKEEFALVIKFSILAPEWSRKFDKPYSKKSGHPVTRSFEALA